MKKVIESLLFISPHALEIEEIARVISMEEKQVEAELSELEKEYQERGIRLVKVAGGYQFRTAPENKEYVRKFFEDPEEIRLTNASLETLSIIAYKQPCSRVEVDNIRGVISDSAIDTLLKRSLIEEVGRADSVGRPMLYRTSEEFLKHFGLDAVADLPVLPQGQKEEETFRDGHILPPEQVGIFDEHHGIAPSPSL